MTFKVLVTTVATKNGEAVAVTTTVLEFGDYSEALSVAKALSSKIHPLDSSYTFLRRSAEILE